MKHTAATVIARLLYRRWKGLPYSGETPMTDHNESPWTYSFDQLPKTDSGRAPLFFTEDQYNHARACVNACAGTPSDILESINVDSLLSDAIDANLRLIETEQQRDELQAKCEAMAAVLDKYPVWHHPDCNRRQVRDVFGQRIVLGCDCGLNDALTKARDAV